MSLFADFKPSILFLGKFLGLYIILNVLYGFYLDAYSEKADWMTQFVTEQTADVLSLYNENITTGPKEDLKSVYIFKDERAVLSVYEGCNGLNVMIIFIAFVFAYSRPSMKMLWFVPVGLIVVHLFNLLRIDLLYHVTLSLPKLLYFSHKFLFTAFIYIAVFGLWALWIFKIDAKK
ncbi:exosortase family protein XrtF [Marivirga atlantica]|jgi:exosortase family protein XrtF|uniref:Exosortase family protein XrtF n=1 Tax=Marivirga atlantica TaxID=1548457 RepID=A0A937AFP7_9BACT|nr:exosortase family protein XrtF [Marivirga atlantica]MBL0765886.1 exosortase family protein XrtF [Marivirga atlantica]